MKRILASILLLCLLAALLSGCAGTLPSPSSPPETAETEIPAEPAPEPTAEPPAVPESLELGFTVPEIVSDEDLNWYFSPEEEFGCGFCYPSYCSVWLEKGALRLSPSWFFARLFFSSVRTDAENAPDELLELLEPGKWGTVPNVGTVGTGWGALRALHLKYDTWRRWVAWETEDRYCLLYGVCFDGREEEVGMIFETIAASFRTGEELLAAAPEGGELLRQSGGVSLYYDGAELGGGASPCVLLRLKAFNEGGEARELSVSACTADGETFPFEASLPLSSGEGRIWTLSLPLEDAESGALFESLGLWITAKGEDGALFELPVEIELNR